MNTDEIRTRHQDTYGFCSGCYVSLIGGDLRIGVHWPCDAIRLADELDRARDLLRRTLDRMARSAEKGA